MEFHQSFFTSAVLHYSQSLITLTLLPTMSIFFLLLLFLISLTIPTSFCAEDYQFTNCSNAFRCGDIISNLKYPFWGGNRAEYCGLPDFKLICEDNINPIIIIHSIPYRILDFDSTSQSLRMARDDFNSLCPLIYKNSTFDPTTFNYNNDVLVNLTFLYNCSTNLSLPYQSFRIMCPEDDNTFKYAYYVLQTQSVVNNIVSNCKSIFMPIFQSQASASMFQETLEEALNEGFGLKLRVKNEECNTCGRSGGECGYNKTEGHFSCFCKDGPHTYSCSQESIGSPQKLGWLLKTAVGVSAAIIGITAISMMIICNSPMHFTIREGKILKEIRAYDHQHFKTFMKDYGTLAPRWYSYSEVKRMTKSFSEKLGQGGYGVVYKATLPYARLAAVKVLNESKGSDEEFINEVASISKTSHVNIVSLLGFCYEKNKRALIYEYMPNGSLDNFIYKRGSSYAFCTLQWKALHQVVIGIARGLEYLHQGCNTRILHFDIKPQNILLDEDFCPKISDFGLAKICKKKESIVSIMGTRGTAGFIAPEVFSRVFGRVSHKSDVFSYGMLVLEMVGGRKNYDSGGSHTDEMYFPEWIYKDLEEGNILGGSLSITEEENEVIRKMTLVSLWCIQTNPSNRPAMSKVVEMLEGPAFSLQIPPKPSLHSPTMAMPALHLSNGSSNDMVES